MTATTGTTTGTLVLLRHGESEWNKANLFTGWVDVALTEKGRGEAARGGDGPPQDRGVQHVGQQPLLGEQLAPAGRLDAAPLGERHVDPAGEQVGLVPLALAVAQQHQRAGRGGLGGGRERRGHAAILPQPTSSGCRSQNS